MWRIASNTSKHIHKRLGGRGYIQRRTPFKARAQVSGRSSRVNIYACLNLAQQSLALQLIAQLVPMARRAAVHLRHLPDRLHGRVGRLLAPSASRNQGVFEDGRIFPLQLGLLLRVADVVVSTGRVAMGGGGSALSTQVTESMHNSLL